MKSRRTEKKTEKKTGKKTDKKTGKKTEKKTGKKTEKRTEYRKEKRAEKTQTNRLYLVRHSLILIKKLKICDFYPRSFVLFQRNCLKIYKNRQNFMKSGHIVSTVSRFRDL